MATSIGKLSKSFFLKLLVGIIILPFVFWGMGDVFRGGNQNVIATVDSNKISTQEFVNYINRLNLNEEQIKNLSKTDLVEQILSDYIGKKVMSLEIEKLGVVVNDNALREIIKNDKEAEVSDKSTDFIESWVDIAKPALSKKGFDNKEENIEVNSERAVLLYSFNNLLTYPWLNNAVNQKSIAIHAWWFDFKSVMLWKKAPDSVSFMPMEF